MDIIESETFLEYLSCGEELYFKYNNNKYFFRGYVQDNSVIGELWDYEHPEKEFIWSYSGEYENAVNSFLTSPIFGGKVFNDAREEIKWCEAFN